MDIQNILLLITAGIIFGVGLFVVSLSVKDKVNIAYFLFSLCVSLWCICLVIFRYFEADFISDLGGKSSYVIGLLMSYVFYLFTLYFPYVSKPIGILKSILFSIIWIYFVIILYFSDLFIIQTVKVNDVVINHANDYNYIFYSLVLAVVVFAGLRNLYNKFSNSEGLYHKQLFILLIVSAFAATLGYIFDIVLCYFENFSFNWLGPLFLTLMALAVGKMILIRER